MPYVGVSQQSFNMRLNIISPEPIKAAHCAALDTRHVWEYYVRDNVNADFAYRNRFQYGASIDSEDSSYCSDLDREAQEELLMIVTSPISIQPMDEPIQRTNLIPAANRYANYVQSPAVPCAFVQRRRRSQSLNDSCLISAA